MPVISTVTSFGEAVLVSITAALATFLAFIPALIGAILILVVGWILAGFIARLVETLLNRVGFEQAATRTGISGFLSRAGGGDVRASRVIAEPVKWFIRLIFLEAAANAIHLTALTDLINRVILWLPSLLVALIVLILGALLGQWLARAVRGAAGQAGVGNAALLAAVARYGVIAFAVLVAMNQVGVAATLVNTLFIGLCGAVALAIGLAFGLGGRETAAEMVRTWYAQGRRLGESAGRETGAVAGSHVGPDPAISSSALDAPPRPAQRPRRTPGTPQP
jgi:hypothetical protein